MARESPLLVKEIDKWGANFAKIKMVNLIKDFLGLINIAELVIQEILRDYQF